MVDLPHTTLKPQPLPTWSPGDPVSPGAFVLPKKHRSAYAQACLNSIDASWVATGASRIIRRRRLNQIPAARRAEVAEQTKKIWARQQEHKYG